MQTQANKEEQRKASEGGGKRRGIMTECMEEEPEHEEGGERWSELYIHKDILLLSMSNHQFLLSLLSLITLCDARSTFLWKVIKCLSYIHSQETRQEREKERKKKKHRHRNLIFVTLSWPGSGGVSKYSALRAWRGSRDHRQIHQTKYEMGIYRKANLGEGEWC